MSQPWDTLRERLATGVAIFAVFGIVSLAVPIVARRFARPLSASRFQLRSITTRFAVSVDGGAKRTLETRPTLAPLIQTSVPPMTFRALANEA